ncbi:MAG TPA: CBS domain-containing protein [Candidatus Dormibacteraeota bacterium]|nr:CBS domain-containing protein [Candidatus Dormibacteraeota bacterium]
MSALPRHRTVSDVMTTRVHVASPLTPFKLLVRLIEENRVSAIPIVDQQGVPIGIVSESDLLLKERRQELESTQDLLHHRKRRYERAKAQGVVASEIMTSPPITVACDTSLTKAARLMYEQNVRRLVVVDERGRIAGIVSRTDLLQVFLRTDEELRDEVVHQLIPAILWAPHDGLGVEVQWNVVTLTGEVDRKSDAEILTRLTRELDGVVGVLDQLSYRWDDSSAGIAPPLSPERRFKAI